MRIKRSVLTAALALFVTAVAPFAAAGAAPGSALPREVLTALQRDLHLTPAELTTRLANEAAAGPVTDDLEDSLGADFGGAWLAGDTAQLTVAITDPAEAATVRAAGATPVVVAWSQDDLDAARLALDNRAAVAPPAVTGWYVDVTTNRVVVEATSAWAAWRFAASTGVARSVRVVVTAEAPRLFYDVQGGDAYFTPQFRCSVGFAVQGGFTTAGHCGTAGQSTSGFNQVAQGSFQASSFPGDDHAWVAVNGNWVPRPIVNGYGHGNVTVRGSREAPIGASICRSGSTSGWRCGRVQAKNQTVRYPQGTVYGLTRTNACAEPGDSGGSFISGSQAQGMTSGGSGNCTAGGTTFFQPVRETLSRFGLTLVTG